MLLKPIPFKLRKFEKGDIIVSDDQIGIFSSLGHHPDGGSCNDDSYFLVEGWCWLNDPIDDDFYFDGVIYNDGNARLARKSERDFLFSRIKKEGCYIYINKITKEIKTYV